MMVLNVHLTKEKSKSMPQLLFFIQFSVSISFVQKACVGSIVAHLLHSG